MQLKGVLDRVTTRRAIIAEIGSSYPSKLNLSESGVLVCKATPVVSHHIVQFFLKAYQQLHDVPRQTITNSKDLVVRGGAIVGLFP